MSVGRPGVALRAGTALILALLIHLAAWQTLAGIRLALSDDTPVTAIEAALLPPVPHTTRLPMRRAAVQATSRGHGTGSHTPAALTAVDVQERLKRRGHPAPPVSPPKPAAEAATGPLAAAPPSPHPAPAASAAAAGPAPAAPPVPAAAAVAPAAANPVAPAPAAALNPALPAHAAGVDSVQRVPGADALARLDPHHGLQPAPITPLPTPSPPAVPAPVLPEHGAVRVTLPRSARLVYESNGSVRVGGLALQVRGHTTTLWTFRDGHYKTDLSIDVVNFTQSSQGSFEPDYGLTPDRYIETRRHNTAFTTSFDWATRHVSFSDGKGRQVAEPGVQDRLSVQFQLAVLRQVYPERFVRGGVMPITLAGTRDVSHWTFTVTGEDVVDSGIGRVRALRVLSNRNTQTGEESLEVWIAERLDWFPVRIRIVDKNRNIIDSVISQADID